jgi:flagellar biosynthetic protein FliR
MPWSSLTIPLLLPAYLLVLFRVAGLLVVTPLFSSTAIPRRLRVMFAAGVALVIFPAILPTVPAHLTIKTAITGVAGEMAVGVLMGLSLHMLFLGAQLTGMVVGQQAGLSLGQTFNPLVNSSTTTIGQLYFIVLFMIFILAGGHRAMVRGLLDSFDAVPLLGFTATDAHLAMLTELLTAAFIMALRLSGPCLIAMFMTTLAMGFLSKTMPQLNILSVGFVVRILVVLAVGGISLSLSGDVFSDEIYETFVMIRNVLGLNG